MMSPIQPSFEVAKGSMNMERNIWTRIMTIIFHRCFRVSTPSIRTYGRSFFHIFIEKNFYRFFISLFGLAQTDSTRFFASVTTFIDKSNYFDSTENQAFSGTRDYSSATLPFNRSTDNGFISFYLPMQRRTRIINHRLTKPMQKTNQAVL